MKRAEFAAALLLLCAAVAGGCQSNRGPKYKLQSRAITLHTEPEGARVYHLAPPTGDRVDLGMTPLIEQPVMVLVGVKGKVVGAGEMGTLMSQFNTARLRIEKSGYEPHDIMIATSPDKLAERKVTLEPTSRPASASR